MRATYLFFAQIIGAIAASGLIIALFPPAVHFRTTLSPGTSVARGLFIEAFLTAELVFTILMLAKEKHKATFIAPVGIGTYYLHKTIRHYELLMYRDRTGPLHSRTRRRKLDRRFPKPRTQYRSRHSNMDLAKNALDILARTNPRLPPRRPILQIHQTHGIRNGESRPRRRSPQRPNSKPTPSYPSPTTSRHGKRVEEFGV